MTAIPDSNDKYRHLLRAIPRRSSPEEGSPSGDLRTLKAWVAALPLASFAACASQLRERLHSMNRTHLDPVDRLQGLEILREPVAQMTAVADKQIIGTSFPLPPQKAELGRLSESFEHELAIGYIECLYDLCAPKASVPLFKGATAALAAMRALEHGSACLQKSYLLYHTSSPGIWQAMHDVYRIAADLGLENKQVGGLGKGKGQRAQSVYTHALLLALIDPYSYTFRELPEIVEITGVLASFCAVRAFKPAPRENEGLRVVDTNEDYGPGYVVEVGDPPRRGLLGVDTSRLFEYMDKLMAAMPEGSNTVELRAGGGAPRVVEIALLRNIIVSLTTEHSRGYERLDSDSALETVIGLHDLHCVLAGNEEFTTFAQHVSGNDDLDIGESIASWAVSVNDHARVLRPAANVLDQSLRGYRLVWDCEPGGESVRAKVGEVVGLRLISDGTSANWMVGAIRWMRIDDEHRVEAGIELLSRRALPVATRVAEKRGTPSRPPVRGILLAPLRSSDSGAYTTLLAPTFIDPHAIRLEVASPQDPARWWNDAGVRNLDAFGTLDRSGTYVHFRLPSLRANDGHRSHAGHVAGAALP